LLSNPRKSSLVLLLSIILGLQAAQLVSAQTGLSFSLGGGANGNVHGVGLAAGPYANGLYSFIPSLAVGLQMGGTFSEILNVLEMGAILRYTFGTGRDAIVNPFLQLGGGFNLMLFTLKERDNKIAPYFSGMLDLAVGMRINVFGSWYVEASVKGGYPYIIGAQLMMGTRIPLRMGSIFSRQEPEEDEYEDDDFEEGDEVYEVYK
jgi:hypothetical protein